MATMMSVYVEDALKQALKDRARAEGLSVNAYVVRILTKEVQGLAAQERLPQRLNRKEEITRAAVLSLEAQYALLDPSDGRRGNRFFPLYEVAKMAGLYPSEALAGLRGLERKGVLACSKSQKLDDIVRGRDDAPEVEHWYRVDRPRTP